MTRILVTGARGFIARPLAVQLAGRGHEVIGLERAADSTPIQGMYEVLAGNLLDPTETARAVAAADPTIVVHLAARGVGLAGERGPKPGIDDLAMTANLLHALDRAPSVRHVVFASSAAVYGPLNPAPIPESAQILPTSDYGISKAAAEVVVHKFANASRTATVLRFANVVGAGERRPSVVSAVCRQIAEAELGRGTSIKHGRLDEARDFVDVTDVARAIVACCGIESPGPLTYNVGSGEAVPISDVVSILAALARTPVQLELDPALVRTGPATRVALDCGALRRRVGWHPEVPLQASLAGTLESWRAELRR